MKPTLSVTYKRRFHIIVQNLFRYPAEIFKCLDVTRIEKTLFHTFRVHDKTFPAVSECHDKSVDFFFSPGTAISTVFFPVNLCLSSRFGFKADDRFSEYFISNLRDMVT